MDGNLLTKTLHSLKWSYAGTIGQIVLQVCTTAAMSRLLPPAAFGVAAMASVFLHFITHFSQMGIEQALIQKKTLTSSDVRCAFTLTAGIGVFCTALAWVVAPFARYLLDTPEIVPVVRALAISFLLTNLSVTSISLLRRQLAFGLTAIVETASFGVGAGLGVTLAWINWGVWAIVVSTVAQSSLTALISYCFVRHDLRLQWSASTYHRMLSYGGRLSAIGFLDYVAGSMDLFAVGKFFGDVAAGIYSRSTLLVNLPVYHLGCSLNRVLFPVLSQVQDHSERRNRAYLASTTALCILLFPIAAGVTIAAPQLITVILGPQWSTGANVLQIYAWVLPLGMIAAQAGIVLDSQALLSGKFRARCIQLSILAVSLTVSANWGVLGIAFAALVGRIAEWWLYNRELRVARLVESFQVLQPVMWGFGYAIVVTLVMLPLVVLGSALPAVVLLIAEVVLAALSLLFLAAILPPPCLSGYLISILDQSVSGEPNFVRRGWWKRLVAARH